MWDVAFNPSFLQYWQSGEWGKAAHLSWADVTGAATYTLNSNGAPSTTSGFTDMRLAVYDDGAGAVTIHWQSVEIVPDTTATFPHGVVSVTFDDSYQSVYDLARPYMDGYGYRGSLMTIVDQIGQSGRLTLAELQSAAQFSGWEVAGHAYTTTAHNAGYDTLTAAQVVAELEQLKGWLAGNGFADDIFAYPSGLFDPTTDAVPIDQIAAEYFSVSRPIVYSTQEAWPPAMPQRLLALTGISGLAGGTPVANLTVAGGQLDRCYYDGCWTILCLHQITAGAAGSTTQISQADFDTLMDGIHSRGIPVLPIGSVAKYYS